MVKRARQASEAESKNSYVGVLLFIVIWPILVTMFARAGGLDGLTTGMSTEGVNVIVSMLLLVPIAVVVFPLLYRMGNIYSLNERENTPSVWQRVTISTVGTAIVLGIIFYLFEVIGFALFYRF